MKSQWQSYREPFYVTLVRTGTISLVAGAVVASLWGGMTQWPMAAMLMLWPALGGHFVEIFFLNWVRPRIPMAKETQIAARVVVWFVGGTALALGMKLTALALIGSHQTRWTAWWIGGVGFIGLELVVHLILQIRGRASFYNGRG